MLDSVGLPFSPERIKVGYETSLRYESDKALALSILRSQSNVIQLAAEYQTSYTNAPIKSVLDYRDFCVAEALKACLYQTQLKNPTTLTAHATKVWNQYSFDDIWPYRSPEESPPDLRYWSPLGTLGYYFQYCNPASAPTLLKDLLSNYWATLGINFTDSPSTKFKTLLKHLITDDHIFVLAQQTVETFFHSLDESPLAPLVWRSAITLDDCLDLKTRLLTGEYSPQLPLILSEVLSPSLFLQIKDVLENTNSVSKPSGLALVTQAFVVEGYSRIIDTLMTLSQSVLLMPLAAWKAERTYSDIHLQVAYNHFLIAEAYAVQAYWSSLDEAAQRSKEARASFRDWASISGVEALDLVPYELGVHFV